jgi:hypothetical protein
LGCSASADYSSHGYYTLESAQAELKAYGATLPVVVPQTDTTFMLEGGKWCFNPGRAMDHHVAEKLDAALAKVGGWSAAINRTQEAMVKAQVGKTVAYAPADEPVRTAAQGECVMQVLQELNAELSGIGSFFTEAALPQTVINNISQTGYKHARRLKTTSTITTVTKIFLVLESSDGNAGAAPPVPAFAVAVAAGEENDPMEELKKMKELLDMGALTQGEFDAKKVEILARM